MSASDDRDTPARQETGRKIGQALRVELAKGKKPSDMGRRDFDAISRTMYDQLSPEARQAMIEDGVLHMVKCVFGEMVAEELWTSGRGYSADRFEVRMIGHKLRMKPPEEAWENLQLFREDLNDATRDRLAESYKSAERWLPLFEGQPASAFLGEIATIKAAKGDPLALSFLAGREVRAA